MTDTIQVTEDDEPFLIQQGQIDTALTAAREKLQTISLTTVCLECGEDIGAGRKKAVPSSTLCIDCQEYEDAKAKS